MRELRMGDLRGLVERGWRLDTDEGLFWRMVGGDVDQPWAVVMPYPGMGCWYLVIAPNGGGEDVQLDTGPYSTARAAIDAADRILAGEGVRCGA